MKNHLKAWKKQYQEIEITEREFNQAIEAGMQKAVKRHRRKQLGIIPSVTIAVILLSLILIINASPTFAAQMAKIPGMERIIELVQFDKGKTAAIENDYYQAINRSVTKGDITFTLDGVIRDENGLVLFYTITSANELHDVWIEENSITNDNGEEMLDDMTSYGSLDEENRGTMEYYTKEEPIEFDNFVFHGEIVGTEILDDGRRQQVRENISIDFHAENTKEAIHYQIDKTVMVEGQKIHVNSVTIQPLRTTVNLYADPDNEMKILAFDDLAIVDQKGEDWSSMSNGIVSTDNPEDESYHLYLQSNYFEQPTSLTLKLSKVQAVEREHDYFRFDLDNEEILYDPYDMFFDMSYEYGELSLSMHARDDFGTFVFGDVFDLNGDKLEESYNTQGVRVDDKVRKFMYTINTTEPIVDVQIVGYPNWLEEEIEIPLK
ncbi:DUF4179 domain-containing protein [Gracilibacillus sp. S3-1-1]|uniref:DUF4179 domain-containing protein n=1 Tax=Gracilibacillus pellucidus TaxID=3095368 RepID=A0ACC6M7F3_9BACI|nr:DUF4179 domain-containing protein [Gracilibacillus sp. S3-1-1]MDX8046911.1 DUF4179 domain-containing protein [Gracilibacillus sp. S3-1-1]